MKRHPSLTSLSHDHHLALVQARRLKRGEVEGFAEFFATELVRHFREEEEFVFPLLAEVGVAPPELVQALLDHQRIRAKAARPDVDLGELMESHIRLEERVLFETIQEVVSEDRLAALLPKAVGGPTWGTATSELNATILEWPPGAGAPKHINAECDVILVVLDGSAEVELGGASFRVNQGEVVVLDKGSERKVTAGSRGVRYLTVHRLRGGLAITRTAPT